jgi:cardiolipin synthase
VVHRGEFPLFFSNLAQKLLNIIFGVTILLMIVVLVLKNDNPVHTLAWILILLYLPVVGFIFYLFFGRNWRKTRLFNRKGLADAINLHDLWPSEGESYREDLPRLASKLVDLLDSNSKAILTSRNKVAILPDTNAALDLIRRYRSGLSPRPSGILFHRRGPNRQKSKGPPD